MVMSPSCGGFGGGFFRGPVYGGPVFGGPVYGGPMAFGGGFRRGRWPIGYYGGWHRFHSHWAGYMASISQLSPVVLESDFFAQDRMDQGDYIIWHGWH